MDRDDWDFGQLLMLRRYPFVSHLTKTESIKINGTIKME
jgi:hypothetical protein